MSADNSLREERILNYLDGRLAGGELEAFELAMFHDPALVDDVEATRALRTGLRTLASQAANDAAPATIAVPRAGGALMRLLPFAASLALGAAVPAYMLWQQPRAADDNGKVQLLAVETVRGRPQAPAIAVDPDASRVVLQFRAIPTPEALDYAVELHRGATLVQRVGALVPNEDDQISIDLPAARLGAGDYSAKITARLADGAIWDYATVEFVLKK